MSGSAILDYLEAQILKISPVGRRQPWWCLSEFDVCIGLLPSPPKKMLDTLLLGCPFNFPCIEISVNLPADSNFRHHQKKSFSSAVRDKQKGRLPSSKNVIRNLYNVEKSASCQITFLMT